MAALPLPSPEFSRWHATFEEIRSTQPLSLLAPADVRTLMRHYGDYAGADLLRLRLPDHDHQVARAAAEYWKESVQADGYTLRELLRYPYWEVRLAFLSGAPYFTALSAEARLLWEERILPQLWHADRSRRVRLEVLFLSQNFFPSVLSPLLSWEEGLRRELLAPLERPWASEVACAVIKSAPVLDPLLLSRLVERARTQGGRGRSVLLALVERRDLPSQIARWCGNALADFDTSSDLR